MCLYNIANRCYDDANIAVIHVINLEREVVKLALITVHSTFVDITKIIDKTVAILFKVA